MKGLAASDIVLKALGLLFLTAATLVGQIKVVAAMLKAIHAQEDRAAAHEKTRIVDEKLEAMKRRVAAQEVRDGIEETSTYYGFPGKHHRQIRTNNTLERIMREIRRRSRGVGSFPDCQSALILVAARLRCIAGSHSGTRQYMSMERLKKLKQEQQEEMVAVA